MIRAAANKQNMLGRLHLILKLVYLCLYRTLQSWLRYSSVYPQNQGVSLP